jgi:hypothetical protein
MLPTLLVFMAAAGGMLRDPVALVTLLRLLPHLHVRAAHAFWPPLKPDELTMRT